LANIKANGILIRQLRQEMRISGKSVSQMALANLSSDRRALASVKGEEPPRWINEFGDRWLSAVETRLEDHFDEALLRSLAYILGTSFESISFTLYANPYKGLRAFGVADAEIFGGRENEARKVFEMLNAHSLVGIIGASGSGKSSLAFAGVCPLIRDEQPALEVLSLRIGARPIESLFYAIDHWIFSNAEHKIDRPTRIRKFQENIRQGHDALYHYLKGSLGETDKTPVLIIDQWEELYTLCEDEKDRETFLQNLIEAVRNGVVRILLTVRADFYDRLLCSPSPFFHMLKPNLFDLQPMTPSQLRKAIERPQKKTGLQFTNGLIDQLLDDVGADQGQLPILQFALSELWINRDVDRNLVSFEAYKNLGGIKTIIKKHADKVIETELDAAELALAQLTLPTLVNVGEHGNDVKLRLPLSQFGPEQQTILRKLSGENCRLLSIFPVPDPSDVAKDVQYVELAHEELIRSWPALRKWLDRDSEFHISLSRLRASYQKYLKEKRHIDYLIPEGRQLEEAKGLLTDYGPRPLGELKTFIDASIDKWKRRADEELHRAKNRTVVASAIAAFAVIALVAATIGFVSARSEGERAEEEALRAVTALAETRRIGAKAAILSAQALSETGSQGEALASLSAALFDLPMEEWPSAAADTMINALANAAPIEQAGVLPEDAMLIERYGTLWAHDQSNRLIMRFDEAGTFQTLPLSLPDEPSGQIVDLRVLDGSGELIIVWSSGQVERWAAKSTGGEYQRMWTAKAELPQAGADEVQVVLPWSAQISKEGVALLSQSYQRQKIDQFSAMKLVQVDNGSVLDIPMDVADLLWVTTPELGGFDLLNLSTRTVHHLDRDNQITVRPMGENDILSVCVDPNELGTSSEGLRVVAANNLLPDLEDEAGSPIDGVNCLVMKSGLLMQPYQEFSPSNTEQGAVFVTRLGSRIRLFDSLAALLPPEDRASNRSSLISQAVGNPETGMIVFALGGNLIALRIDQSKAAAVVVDQIPLAGPPPLLRMLADGRLLVIDLTDKTFTIRRVARRIEPNWLLTDAIPISDLVSLKDNIPGLCGPISSLFPQSSAVENETLFLGCRVYFGGDRAAFVDETGLHFWAAPTTEW
jgi:hypothetical protein